MRKLLLSLAACGLIGGCAGPGPQSADQGDGRAVDRQADAFSTYLSARFADSEHDMSMAARYYSQSLKEDPDNEALLGQAFFFAITAGDVDSAGKYALQIVAKKADDQTARTALAIIAFKRHDYADVRKQLTLSAKSPFTVPLFDAWAAAATGDAAGATADIKALLAQTGTVDLGTFHNALILDKMNKPDDADAAYRKAVTLRPASLPVVEAYGNFLERQGRAADASAYYNKLISSPGLKQMAQSGLARIAAGKKPEPIIRNIEDGAAEALFSIGAELSDKQSAEISILYLRMGLYLRPDFGLAQMVLASRYESLEKYQDAQTIYAAIDKASDYYRRAAVSAAVDRERLGERDEAIRALKVLADADEGDSDTWITLGDAYRDAGKSEEAIAAYDHAEKALGTPAKRDWTLFYARAMAQDKAHHWDKAEADINTGLKLSPDQPELLNYLGYSWVDQGRRIPEALAMLEKARALRPYDGYVVDSVGWAYYRLGRYDEAAKTLQAAILLVPGDSTINDHLGDALWKAGRKIDARFQWNHALTFSENTEEKASIEQKLKTGLAG